MTLLVKICKVSCAASCIAACLGMFAATAVAATADAPAPLLPHAEQVRIGFKVAQACEVEIDDDLTSYGECIGHAADRLAGQRLGLLGLNFQAWMMADLAARQGSTRSLALRTRYKQALTKGLRTNRWTVKQLCEIKQLACAPVELRLKQKL